MKRLVKKFEDGAVNPRTGKQDRRPLKPDQALFAAALANACNAAWGEGQENRQAREAEGDPLPAPRPGQQREDAMEQEIALLAMGALFPVKQGKAKSTLIVCAKLFQAATISTDARKAVSCHRAGGHRSAVL